MALKFESVKGQLISECIFGFLNFPKNQQKIWQISAQESKKWSNHKIMAPYIVFNTINNPYNYNIIRIRDHPFKTSVCLRGEGCLHVPMVKRSQYIRTKNPLHKHFAGMPMVADTSGSGSKIVKICLRLKWMVPILSGISSLNFQFWAVLSNLSCNLWIGEHTKLNSFGDLASCWAFPITRAWLFQAIIGHPSFNIGGYHSKFSTNSQPI